MDAPELRRLIELADGTDVASLPGAELLAADVAEALTLVDAETGMRILDLLDDERAAEALVLTDDHTRQDLLPVIDPDRLVRLIDELDPDDAADLLPEVPREQQGQVLAGLDAELRADVERLVRYPPESAGGIMTTDVVAVAESATARNALTRVAEADQPETISTVYVTDADEHLVGVVSLRDLLTADPATAVSKLMDREVISVTAEADQEEAAKLVDRYHLSSIPVVDGTRRLLGLITVDDVLDVLEEEASEDMLRLAGTNVNHPTTEPLGKRLRARAPWLTVTLLGTFLAGLLLEFIEKRWFPSQLGALLDAFAAQAAGYEDDIAAAHAFKMLLYYIPLIGGMAGNVGSQSSTIMVRGFATGEVNPHRPGRVLGSELLLALIIGVAGGALVGVLVALTHPDHAVLGLIVGLALPCAIVTAALAGTLIPFACQVLRVDPAYAGGPFLLTLNDLAAYAIYFAVAVALLGQMGRSGLAAGAG